MVCLVGPWLGLRTWLRSSLVRLALRLRHWEGLPPTLDFMQGHFTAARLPLGVGVFVHSPEQGQDEKHSRGNGEVDLVRFSGTMQA